MKDARRYNEEEEEEEKETEGRQSRSLTFCALHTTQNGTGSNDTYVK